MTSIEIIEKVLRELKNKGGYSVDQKIATKFNRWAKVNFSDEYHKAKKIRETFTKEKSPNGEVLVKSCHPLLKNYEIAPSYCQKSPTQAQILSDTIVFLARVNPIIL